MKAFSLVLLGGALLFSQTGCLKSKSSPSCTPATVDSEAPAIAAFAAANGINATKHSSGLYYEIVSPGNGATPSPTSKVFVTYTGKLLDGRTFDSQTDASKTGWVLNTLIPGWQIGLPLIQKGGAIKLLIPSALGYACGGAPLPPNSVLYFDIQLVDVQ